MVKYFFIRFCICLGFCAALCLCVCFFGFIVEALFEMSQQSIYIFSGILGIIGTIIVIVALHFICGSELKSEFENEKNLQRHRDDKEFPFMNFWYRMLANNKKVSIWKCILCLLPMAVIGIFMFILARNTHFNLDYSDTNAAGIMIGKLLAVNLLGVNRLYWLILFVYSFFHYLRFTCIKCGAVFSFIEDNTSDYNLVDNIQTKKRDIYGTIGTVYSDNEKVGEVRGKVGTLEKKYRTFGSIYNSHCHCLYCGKRRKFHVNDVSTERIE